MKTFMCILLSVLMLSAKANPDNDSATKKATKANKETYWTLETGKTGNNSYSVIRFYDANNNLLMEKKLENVALNGERGSIQRKLSRALKAYVAQPSVANDYLAVLENRKSAAH